MSPKTSCERPCFLKPVKTHDTSWDPARSSKVTLNIALDGCIVPTETGSARVDYSHLIVIDNFIDEQTRQHLIDYLTQPGWTSPSNSEHSHPPEPKWEQATCDAADAADRPRARTWGLTSSVLQHFAAEDIPAKLEVQSRLCKLYPDMTIAHMPSEHIQVGLGQDSHYQHHPTEQQSQDGPASAVAADCSSFLANAAVAGDNYSWHVDADPATFPSPSPWTTAYGNYCNREPGKPLLFSLLLYLDKEWPLGYDAETLFLDSITDTGIFVRPKAYRAVLMDQDVAHRLSAPSVAAGRPRYSLVWKLVMLPKQQPQQQQGHSSSSSSSCSLARPEWGPPTYFGSAAHVKRAAAMAAACSKAEAGTEAATGPAVTAVRKRPAHDLQEQ